jgi:hypothetical protein
VLLGVVTASARCDDRRRRRDPEGPRVRVGSRAGGRDHVDPCVGSFTTNAAAANGLFPSYFCRVESSSIAPIEGVQRPAMPGRDTRQLGS